MSEFYRSNVKVQCSAIESFTQSFTGLKLSAGRASFLSRDSGDESWRLSNRAPCFLAGCH